MRLLINQRQRLRNLSIFAIEDSTYMLTILGESLKAFWDKNLREAIEGFALIQAKKLIGKCRLIDLVV